MKSKKKDYYLSQEQLDDLDHYKRMFRLNSESIWDLCNTERDDVVYGFVLGQRYTHLEDCFIKMMEIVSDIEEQKIK